MLARTATLVGAAAGVVWVRALWRMARGLLGAEAVAWRCLAGWYALKVMMEAAGALGLATWAARARQPTLLYLHVLLVGFVSLGLLVPLLKRLGRPLSRGLLLHNTGLLGMAGGLALLGAGTGGLAWAAPWLAHGYLVAAMGAVPIVLAGLLWLVPGVPAFLRVHRSPPAGARASLP